MARKGAWVTHVGIMTSEGVTAGGATRASTPAHVIMYARSESYALLVMPNLLQLKWWMGGAEAAGYAADPTPIP